MPSDPRDIPDEPPPLLGAWRNVYIALIIYLAVLISLCYVFMRSFS